MILRLLKTAVVKLLGLILFIGGVGVGLIAFYGEEPWQRNVVVKYGGAIIAWGIAGLGIGMMAYKATKAPVNPDTE